MLDFYKDVFQISIFVFGLYAIGIPAGILFFYLIDKLKKKK